MLCSAHKPPRSVCRGLQGGSAIFMAGVLAGSILWSVPTSAQIPQAEREALIALYNSTNGSEWTDNSGWRKFDDSDFSDPGTECGWEGVKCSWDDHVYQIYLPDNNLNGTLPSELANLTSRFYLTVPGNNFGTDFPMVVTTYSALRVLNLSECGLTGPIPAEVGNLSDLYGLVLRNNDLSGPIPPELSNLRRLSYLELQGNDLSGPIPEQLGDMDELGSLELQDNQLTGEIPAGLRYLSRAYEIRLSRNQLTGSIPAALGDLSRLQTLALDFNNLTGPIPPEVMELPRLYVLLVNDNRIDGSIPAEITSTNLTALYAQNNRLQGTIPPGIGAAQNLRTLDLKGNMLHGPLPSEITQLTRLIDSQRLRLSWNALFTDDAAVQDFVDQAHDPDLEFAGTQTVAPENLMVESVHDRTVWLTWDAIGYLADEGGYTVFSAPFDTDAWVQAGFTSSKGRLRFPVTNLEPGQSYDLAVASFTSPHASNANLVASELSSAVMATTSDAGCVLPVVTVDPPSGPSYALSVEGSFDGFEWSTGETSPTITVAPQELAAYWVNATSPGPCEEAAVIVIDPSFLFSDGFEVGNASSWSATTP